MGAQRLHWIQGAAPSTGETHARITLATSSGMSACRTWRPQRPAVSQADATRTGDRRPWSRINRASGARLLDFLPAWSGREERPVDAARSRRRATFFEPD